MTKTIQKKGSKLASSENYNHLNYKIISGNSTLKEIKEKREEIKENISTKVPQEQIDIIYNFEKILFTMLKDAADKNITSNKYLFELLEDATKNKKLYDGMYKINVIKKNNEKIICKIQGANYQTNLEIDNGKIMEKKTPQDKLEEIFTIVETYKNKEGKIIKKNRPGKKEDFLDEIEYGDSVIIDVQNGKIRKIKPDNIIEEVGKYIKKNDNAFIKSKKIQTAMTFFNESQEQLSGEYLKDFSKFIKEETEQKNSKNTVLKVLKSRKDYLETFKKIINEGKIYVHKGNDIDKSAIKLLLKKFGTAENHEFNEINHENIENIDEGIFFDVDTTVNGFKVIKKQETTKEGKKTTKTKIIFSEHSDNSDNAMLTNRSGSTTQMIYNIFKYLGAIDEKKIEQVQRFVNFVNIVDSMGYQIGSVNYIDNHQTLFGLYRMIDIEDIFKYFKNPEHSGFEKLSKEYMTKTKVINTNGEQNTKNLWEISKNHERRINKNIERFNVLKNENKKITHTKNGLNFIVDIENKEKAIKDGPQTAGYADYGYFTIKEGRGNIYMYSQKKLPLSIGGFPTKDNHFLIIDNPTKEDIEKLFKEFRTSNDTLKNDIIYRIENIKNTNSESDSKKQMEKTIKAKKILQRK